MGRGTGLAKLALGMGALRAANTAVRAAAWSSYPRYYSYPYGYYNYYSPYYYGGYGYGYGSSRGAGWFIAAFCIAIAGACCLLIPGIAGIICCGVGIVAALGFTITGIVKANSAPSTVVVRDSENQSKSQEQSQTQSKGNCVEKVKYATKQPIDKQMGIVSNGQSFEIKSNREQEQMAKIKTKPEYPYSAKYPYSANFMKNNSKSHNAKYCVYNTNAKFSQINLDKNLKKVIDMR